MYKSRRGIYIEDNSIYLDTKRLERIYDKNHDFTIQFSRNEIDLHVYVDDNLIQTYNLKPITDDENFKSKFFHFRVVIRTNDALMIDGLISGSRVLDVKSKENLPVRFQPIFVSNRYINANSLKGKGLVARGLHYSGAVTSGVTRFVCVCDECRNSFMIQSFHSGFSDVAYFYSDDGLNTLHISTWEFQGLPGLTTKNIDHDRIKKIESQLPKLPDGQSFKYYNSFCCPHCLSPYID